MMDNMRADAVAQPYLPVYLLLDTSGSMIGAKLKAVSAGVARLCAFLQLDPRSVATVRLSVVTFDDTARMTPLVPISHFSPPRLTPIGKTALGAALRELNAALDASPPRAYRPLVYLLTDGQPSDEWRPEAERLRHRRDAAPLYIVGLAVGDDADEERIAVVADPVFRIDGDWEAKLRDYFDWVGASVARVTHHHLERGDTPSIGLPVAPKTVNFRRGTLPIG